MLLRIQYVWISKRLCRHGERNTGEINKIQCENYGEFILKNSEYTTNPPLFPCAPCSSICQKCVNGNEVTHSVQLNAPKRIYLLVFLLSISVHVHDSDNHQIKLLHSNFSSSVHHQIHSHNQKNNSSQNQNLLEILHASDVIKIRRHITTPRRFYPCPPFFYFYFVHNRT